MGIRVNIKTIYIQKTPIIPSKERGSIVGALTEVLILRSNY